MLLADTSQNLGITDPTTATEVSETLHQPLSESTTSMKRRMDQTLSSSPRDLRELYALSKGKKPGSARSVTTSWSTCTEPASNTTGAIEQKKQQKRRFRSFATILMKLLARKNPRVFNAAQEVVRDCEERKLRGEPGYESVTDSLKDPLREVVGATYWKEAQAHAKNRRRRREHLSEDRSIASFGQKDVSQIAAGDDAPPPPHIFDGSPLSTRSSGHPLEEKKVRRERFYLLLRILMKHLETKDHELYLKAKDAIQDCVDRHGNKEEGYESVTSSIQRSIKEMVGLAIWRSAESFLCREIQKKDKETAFGSLSNEDLALTLVNPEEAHSDIHRELNMEAIESERQTVLKEFYIDQSFETGNMEEIPVLLGGAQHKYCGMNMVEIGIAGVDRKRPRLHTHWCEVHQGKKV